MDTPESITPRTGRYSHAAGHTLRRAPRGLLRGFVDGKEETFKGQFSIHKSVRAFHEGYTQEEIESVSEEFGDHLDDGGLELGTAGFHGKRC